MKTSILLSWPAVVAFALVAATSSAQRAEVIKNDGVTVYMQDGQPRAVTDDQLGMTIKPIGGRMAVFDSRHKVMLLESADGGAPIMVDYSQDMGAIKAAVASNQGNMSGGKLDPKAQARMKQFMEQAKQRSTERADGTRGDPKNVWDARAERYRPLLEPEDDEWNMIIKPFLIEVLKKQDEIRRSTVEDWRLSYAKRLGSAATLSARNPDLPEAIRKFQDSLAGEKKVATADMRKRLEAFRGAREKQDTELKQRRDKLREVLTVDQEAKLAATGVLD